MTEYLNLRMLKKSTLVVTVVHYDGSSCHSYLNKPYLSERHALTLLSYPGHTGGQLTFTFNPIIPVLEQWFPTFFVLTYPQQKKTCLPLGSF